MGDEEFTKYHASKILDRCGCTVDRLEEGAKAIELYRAAMEAGEPYDAVILDVDVPSGLGGKEAVKELLQIDPQVKTLVCSGHSNDTVMADPEHFGFSGVLAKPFEADALPMAIHRLLTTSQSREVS